MWMLKDESSKFYYLKENEPFVIGRNRGDLVLSEDGSISRAHAKIQIVSGKCIVTDTKSKYGTFLLHEDGRTEQITGDYTVKNNDRVRFGLQNSILKFNCINYVILTSSIKSEDKEELQKIIKEIDGRIVSEWTNECTHLTVSSTKLTEKLSCSLVAGLPIVTKDYWTAVKKALESGKELPDPRDFTPILDDTVFHTNNTSLQPNPLRKTIFSNLSFVHFRKNQLEIYKKMIALAGGKSVFYGSKNFDENLLSDKNTILVLYSEENTQNEPYKVPGLASVQSFLKKSQRRMIPDNEIPLAILYASVEHCCNPKFHYGSLLKAGREKKFQEGETLVADTQDAEGGDEGLRREQVIIPETESFGAAETSRFDSSLKNESLRVNASSSERKRSRSNEDEDVQEKRARFEDSQEDGGEMRVFSCIKKPSKIDQVEKAVKNEESISIDSNSEEIESQKLENIRKIFSGSVNASQRRIIPETNEEDDDEHQYEDFEIDEVVFKEPFLPKEAKKKEVMKEEVKKKEMTNKEVKKKEVTKKEVKKKEITKNEMIEDDGEQEDEWTRIEDEDRIGRIDESIERQNDEIIGDANSTFLRREFFTGKTFGKRFTKVPVNIPENRITEWRVGPVGSVN